MKRCLEIFLIMRYLHVRSQEDERGGGMEVGSRARLNRFANALQYAPCLEPPAEGGRNQVARLALAKSMDHKKDETKARKMAQKCQRGKVGDQQRKGGMRRKEGEGELRYVNFVC